MLGLSSLAHRTARSDARCALYVLTLGLLASLSGACSSSPIGSSTDNATPSDDGAGDNGDTSDTGDTSTTSDGDTIDGSTPANKLDAGATVKRDGSAPAKPDGGGGQPATADAGSSADASKPALDAGSTKADDAATSQDAAATSSPDAATSSPDAGPVGAGCTGTTLLKLGDDMKARGPWDVGVRTVKIGRLTVEAFYPAQPGSTANVPEATWDLTSFLPESERSKIPASHAAPVGALGGHVYRDVPLDGDHGPYPVVIFIHGTASFRVGSASTNAHWASRGLVVLAADYPGLGLADQLAVTAACSLPTSGDQDLPSDVSLQLAALKAPTGDVAFLDKHLDMTRVGISGHSQGACIAATLSTDPGVRIVLPLDGATGAATSSTLESVMYVSGMADQVIGYDSLEFGSLVCPTGSVSSKSAYQASPGPPKVKKRLVGIKGGGHLVPTDLCRPNTAGKVATKESEDDGVCGISSAVNGLGLSALSDCGTIDWMAGVEAVNYATAAALEETLLCQDRTKQFATLKTNEPLVGEFLETVK